METNYRNGDGIEKGDVRHGNTAQRSGGERPGQAPLRESGPGEAVDESSFRAVSAFLGEFVLLVKHRRTYPSEHPLVVASTARVLAHLSDVLAKQEELTVGVAKQGLFVGKNFLEPYNQRFKMLAGILVEHGIATITFTRLASAADLHHLTGLLEIQPAKLWEMGGAGEVLAAAGVFAVQVMSVSPDYFQLREESELPEAELDEGDGTLWENFLRSLGEEGLLPGTGGKFLEPAELARLLSEAAEAGIDVAGRLSAAQKRFVDRVPPQVAVYSARSLEQILRFVIGLSARLRKLFLTNLFGVTPDKGTFVETLAEELPNETIMDALMAVSSESYVPPFVQRLMARLSSVSESQDTGRLRADEGAEVKMQVLFRRDQIEQFVPEEYRETLVSILSAEALPDAYREEMAELVAEMEAETIELKTADLILELVRTVPLDGMTDGLVRNLRELADYFLATGDFVALGRICGNLGEMASLPSAARFVSEMGDFVGAPGFTDNLFDSLEVWGKDKRLEITTFIGQIGPIIIPALLDRLAGEPNMSLRRFYMDRLMELGTAARDAAIERLGDPRWFFVRNLIILLRTMNDPVGIEHVRALAAHPHPKIREEVLKTLRHSGESVREEVLLGELYSDEREKVLKAIHLAESSPSDTVMARLVEIVSTRRLAGFDLELKAAAVSALASIGNPQALPALEQVLRSRNLLHPILHNRLRLEIIGSLDRYPAKETVPILESIARSPGGEAAKLAQRIIREQARGKGG